MPGGKKDISQGEKPVLLLRIQRVCKRLPFVKSRP